VQSSGSGAAGNVIVETGEPAALVAERLGPSVVQVETDFGLGSGVIYRDGYVLTNNHVIDGAEILKVRLSTGENFDATLIGTDESKDLAVLSVGTGRNLPVAELAMGQVRVGQIAVAIGSPFQLQQTVTAGIVSAVDRPIPSRTPGVVVAMIQTDAPINPGNSGGALADKDGRVIGINTAIQTDGFSGTNAGVGFAIPIDDAVRIADLLVSGEPIESGFLGVTGRSPADGSAGVEIIEVTSGSAAEAAGLKTGDRVLSLDGAPVTQIEELAGLVLAHQAGDLVSLHVVRGDDEIRLDATLGVRE
jgi:S1-C subfamily serine protease